MVKSSQSRLPAVRTFSGRASARPFRRPRERRKVRDFPGNPRDFSGKEPCRFPKVPWENLPESEKSRKLTRPASNGWTIGRAAGQLFDSGRANFPGKHAPGPVSRPRFGRFREAPDARRRAYVYAPGNRGKREMVKSSQPPFISPSPRGWIPAGSGCKDCRAR